jgi:hypothetical protein
VYGRLDGRQESSATADRPNLPSAFEALQKLDPAR